MSEERLQKLLARAGVASRRKAEELIEEGRVTINGEVAELGAKADPERDSVKLDGKRIVQPREHRYLLLHKPRGVMSTVSDPVGRQTVIDLVPPALRKALVPIGRLDYQTEGLLLLTDDGEFAQRVAHPRYGCVKTYEVKVKGRPTADDIARLEAGVVLEGRRTWPSRIEPLHVTGHRERESDNSWWKIHLSEGRTRQIREMFHRIGHSVQKLRRVGIGAVSDPTLPLGAIRELTDREVESLRQGSGGPSIERRVRTKEEEKAKSEKKEKREKRKEGWAVAAPRERMVAKTPKPATFASKTKKVAPARPSRAAGGGSAREKSFSSREERPRPAGRSRVAGGGSDRGASFSSREERPKPVGRSRVGPDKSDRSAPRSSRGEKTLFTVRPRGAGRAAEESAGHGGEGRKSPGRPSLPRQSATRSEGASRERARPPRGASSPSPSKRSDGPRRSGRPSSSPRGGGKPRGSGGGGRPSTPRGRR